MKNILQKRTARGYFLAGLAALAVSNVYIFSKAALLEVPLFSFGFYWFLLAFLYNLGLIVHTGKIKLLLSYQPETLRLIGIIATFELLAAVLFFAGMQQIESPSVASFLNNTTPVFVTLISIPLLKERFTKLEGAGIMITLTGAFMLSYSGNLSLTGLFVKGANTIIFSCLTAAIGLVIAKKNIKNVDPYILSFSRTVFLLGFYLIAVLVSGQTFQISGKAFMNIALGSFFGPFLGAVFQYSAFRYIEVSKESLIQNTNGLFVIITGYLYLGLLPVAIQITGGIITIAGVSMMVLGRTILSKRNRA